MKRDIRSKNRRDSRICYETLEPKRLLAGDVAVFLNGSVLQIAGDNQANQVQVTQVIDGSIQIAGRDTTINGSSAAFEIANTFLHMTIALGDGNDEMSVNDLVVRRNFSYFGGSGNDHLVLNNLNAYHFHLQGDVGDDVIELNGATTRKSAYVYLGDGDDVLTATVMSAGRNFRVFGGNGNDTVTTATVNVRRKLTLDLGNGNDQALLTGSTTASKKANIRLGKGDDFLGILPLQTGAQSVFERLRVHAGNGNDVVALDAGVTTNRKTRINGGRQVDSVAVDGASLSRNSIIRNFENQSTENLPASLDTVFARLRDVGIEATLFGDSLAALAINLNQTPLTFTENGAPVSFDPTLEITGANAIRVASASVQIVGVSSAEILLFDDTDNIRSSFDSSTGTLTLAGAATIADYQNALRSVRYSNTTDNPTADDRVIRVSVNSAESGTAAVAERSLRVLAVDDPLLLSLPGSFGDAVPVNFNIGQLIQFTAQGIDPDNKITYQLDLDGSGIPASASQPTMDPQSGRFTWTPDVAGRFSIRVIATNDIFAADQELFTVIVS